MDQYGDYLVWSPSTPSLSDSSPVSSASSSPFLPSTPHLGSCSAFPLSPPAPHRKAPRPPTYTPRRHRARHIQMREPARVGLFTVSEMAEDEARAAAVAAVLERSDLHGPGLSSSSTTEASESGCETPGYESEDPFSFEFMWRSERDSVLMADSDDDDIGLGLGIGMSRTFTSRPSSRSSPANRSGRRPPPLSLVSSRHPYQLPSPPAPSPSHCAAPKLKSSALLPALPIYPVPSNAQRNRPQSPRTPTRSRRPGLDHDLLLQFAELLESCGEDTASAHTASPSLLYAQHLQVILTTRQRCCLPLYSSAPHLLPALPKNLRHLAHLLKVAVPVDHLPLHRLKLGGTMRAPKRFRHGGKAKVSSIAPRLTAQQGATRQVAAGNRYRSARRFLGNARCEALHQVVVLDEPDDRHDEMIL